MGGRARLSRFLLDTHILIWWVEDHPRLSRKHRSQLRAIPDKNPPAYVSDITLWEVAVLVEKGRLRVKLPLREWLERAVASPLVERVAISPAIAEETTRLPAGFQRDPADRILVATARVLGVRLMTVDERIIRAAAVPVV